MWDVLNTDPFTEWFDALDVEAQMSIVEVVRVLQEFGPRLGRPFVDTLKESKLINLKELRVQSKGRPFRILFIFDPKRNAVLLIGGNKQGDKRFYKKMIPLAEKIYEEYRRSQNEE